MTIKTKYNIGDEVWVIFRNKAILVPIDKIRIFNELNFVTDAKKIVDYVMRIQYCFLDEWVDEENLFSSKEELIKSL